MIYTHLKTSVRSPYASEVFLDDTVAGDLIQVPQLYFNNEGTVQDGLAGKDNYI